MPKSKKPTPTQRQTPYPTPATPANPNPRSPPTAFPNLRSTPTAPSNPGARFFTPSPRFALRLQGSVYPQTTLTPYEAGQSLRDFCLDLQNGTQRPRDVDENVHLGSGGIRGVKGDGKGTYDAPTSGEGSGTGRKRRVEKVVRDGVVDHAEEISKKTSKLSKRRDDKETLDPLSDSEQIQLPTGVSEDLSPFHDPHPPAQHPASPRESPPSDPDLAPPPNSLTEEQVWLADLLKPVADFNARTLWPVPSYGQPVVPPNWHDNCPGGYKPTTLAGLPQRRQYPMYMPAAHSADIIRDESGHYCLDLDEWDRCVMGKCGGCEICRPGA